MKIGLLICDHVKEKFKHIGGDYPKMFGDLLPNLEFEVYFVIDNHFPEKAEECDAYLVSGSVYSVYENVDWIIRLKAFVKEIQEKNLIYVGVCFGHQLLGEALDGKVEKAKTGWCVGVHSFSIIKEKGWMQPSLSSINLLMSCQDQIVKLPSNTTVLATSEKCPFAMIQVGENMIGIQAHPEFTKGYSRGIMKSRIERIGSNIINEGIESLAKPLNQIEVSKWIENFMAYAHSSKKLG